MAVPEHFQALVCGAGPVGLLIALRLGQAGIRTLVIERHHELLTTTRALGYHPVVLDVFKDLGILDRIKAEANLVYEFYWRKPDGTELAHFPFANEDEYLINLGQQKMNALFLDELRNYASVTVRFDTEIGGFEQGDGTITALLHTKTTFDDYFVKADLAVGTDGANSRVRQSLSIPFEGFSYDFRMVGVDVQYDFGKHMGSPMNFIVDPEDWAIVVYAGQDSDGITNGPGIPLWRVAYSEPAEYNITDIKRRAQERISRYANGRKDLDIQRAEPYQIHQRCAKVAFKGRVGLAGDALHSNNPIGGLGLTTGILDAHTYGQVMVRILQGGEPVALFGQAAEARRAAWKATTGPWSYANLKRIASEAPEDVAERESFFAKLRSENGLRELRALQERMRGESFTTA